MALRPPRSQRDEGGGGLVGLRAVTMPQPPGQRRRDGLRRRGIAAEKIHELRAREPEHLAVGVGADRRRPRLIDEERELADVVTGTDRIEPFLVRAGEHRERAVHDDVERIADLSLTTDPTPPASLDP